MTLIARGKRRDHFTNFELKFSRRIVKKIQKIKPRDHYDQQP